MHWTPAQVSELRSRLKMSPGEFAKLLGVDVRTVHRYESGESTPTGSAEAVLLGVQQALASNPDGVTRGLAALGALTALGGLGLLIAKLFEYLAKENQPAAASKETSSDSKRGRRDRK